VSLLERLNSEDDLTRLLAAEEAARTGGPELVAVLLDLALHDPAEVKTTGGAAERWENVSDAAATGLGGVLARQGGLDERIRRAACDLAHDDERVARLLRTLGDGYEPLRRELETSGEERLRLRALTAVLPFYRPEELNRRFLADPSPLVRAEAVRDSTRFSTADLERALTDPSPRVRLVAARRRQVRDGAAFVVAARAETDPRVRRASVDGLAGRPLSEPCAENSVPSRYARRRRGWGR
jgi:hypothetical protein